MRRFLADAKLGRAAILFAALLLLGVAASSFHGHDTEPSSPCAVCALASAPAETHHAVVAEQPTLVDVGTVWVADWRPSAPQHRTSLGSRAPPAPC